MLRQSSDGSGGALSSLLKPWKDNDLQEEGAPPGLVINMRSSDA